MSTNVLLFFAMTFVLLYMFYRARIGALIAFLIAGLLAGPYVFGFFELNTVWKFLGDLGILFLLFSFGLEINMSRLWSMRRNLISFGSAQVLMVAVILFPILFNITSWGVIGALLISLVLAMSSTSQDVQILVQRNQLNSDVGRQSFSILLFQDLLSIPLLATLPVFTGKSFSLGATFVDVIVLSILLMLGVLVVGRWILSPVFKWIAKTKSRELMILAVMLNILFWACVMHWIGLPMGLGGFLAGMLMSETIYRHQIVAEIKPYALLFLALFFMALGLELDLNVLLDRWYFVIGGAIGLVLIKFCAIFMVARVRRVPVSDAAFIGALLAQGGEFALLILQMIRTSKIDYIPVRNQDLLMAIVVLSIMMTPFVMWIYDQLNRSGKLGNRDQIRNFSIAPVESPTVIICGFGRVGQIVARVLSTQKISYLAIDTNINAVMVGREQGFNVVYGDVTNMDVLRGFGLNSRKTRAVVIALNNAKITDETILSVKTIAPRIKIFARARNLDEARHMMKSGVTRVFPETIESSFMLAYGVLTCMGYSRENVRSLLHEMRADNYAKINSLPEKN